MAHRYVFEYTNEELEALSPSYRNRILRARKRNPRTLVSEARGAHPRERAPQIQRTGRSILQIYPGGISNVPINKANARKLYYEWLVRTSMVPTTILSGTRDVPLVEPNGVPFEKYTFKDYVVRPSDSMARIRRVIGAAQEKRRGEEVSRRSYEESFDRIWEAAVHDDRRQGTKDARSILMSMFFQNAIAAEAWRKDKSSVDRLNRSSNVPLIAKKVQLSLKTDITEQTMTIAREYPDGIHFEDMTVIEADDEDIPFYPIMPTEYIGLAADQAEEMLEYELEVIPYRSELYDLLNEDAFDFFAYYH